MTELTKKDCFAFKNKSCDCGILLARICDFRKCPFYKTQIQFDIGAVHTMNLTGSDGEEKFMSVLKKYRKKIEVEQFYLLKGQALSGDLNGTRKGLEKVLRRINNV